MAGDGINVMDSIGQPGETDRGDADLICRLFYLATVRLEAATDLAVRGQTADAAATSLAHQLHAITSELQVISDAIIALTDEHRAEVHCQIGQAVRRPSFTMF